jgi:hypothetical protein
MYPIFGFKAMRSAPRTTNYKLVYRCCSPFAAVRACLRVFGRSWGDRFIPYSREGFVRPKDLDR